MDSSIAKIIDDALDKLESRWSEWQMMPCPENCRKILGPKNSGIYQIRHKQTERLILLGTGKECQKRMRSLFPSPYGTGRRNNERKRNYVLKHWKNLEYRTMETNCIEDAISIEHIMIARNNHCFNT